MKKQTIITFGLLLGFSANSVFAENKAINYSPAPNGLADRIAQVQLQATEAKSRFLDEADNPEITFKKIKVSRTIPKSNNNNGSKKRDPKPPAAGREKSLKEKINLLKKLGNLKSTNEGNLPKTKVTKAGKGVRVDKLKLSKREAKIYNLIKNGRNLDQLSLEQRTDVLNLHKRMLKTRDAQILLRTIQIGEAGGLLVIVGKGQGKSKLFKQYMANLTTKTHPAYQFPAGMRCFVHNKQLNRCSTAAGLYQITKTNFDYYQKYLGIKDFSKESQDIMALELIRTGRAVKVQGNYKGRGYVELINGKMNNTIRYGTNDWASSLHSQWKPHNRDYTKIAPVVAKNMNKQKTEKLKDSQFFQSWIDESINGVAGL